ncbi:dihydroorotase [Marinomonas sp. SBI22]|uniref:dihydroorotase n=1 Tax=unclassified Marinomonas TaxID=196814 RepID=UPI0007AF6D3A|nr:MULTISPECIES: dihydroorotase [unclassified Marinomonas]KZM40306.1 dihydroorotase [Marinomonas sp. SBI22]KZM41723.1 dihydroorotase [Marinomonas sp. SBI8L]
MKTCIKNGRIIDPSQELDAELDLYIEDEKIVALGDAPAGFVADETIDASGQWVLPGLIDLAVSLREPGYTQKGNIASETLAAASGGVTTLVCQPDTKPIVDTPAVAALIQDKAFESGRANVLPIGALTQGLEGKKLSNMVALTEAGCVAVSNHRHPMVNTKVLSRALEYASTHDLLVIFHPDETSLSDGGCAHEGVVSTMHGLSGIPETAETIALARDLMLIEKTKVKAHFARLSSAKAVEMVADAKASGLDVTADVALHNLLLTDNVLSEFDGHYHVLPPLRSEDDRLTLIEGIKAGVISAICSDHQPHEKMAKIAPFSATEPGMANLEILLPLAMTLMDEGDLDFNLLLTCLTQGPASCLGIEAGSLSVGSYADLVLFDSTQRWEWSGSNRKTKGQNSPWIGENLIGKVVSTYLSGQKVFPIN